jgi:diketogulonate reductase-like aldo/keto reductase
VERALRLGFRGIDTACQPKHYNEAGVGDGVAACLRSGIDRAELYLQSKFTPLSGQDSMQVPYDTRSSLSEQVAQSFQTSLKNLQTPYLDCLVLHSPLVDQQQLLEVWQAMELIFHSGGTQQLGISNCYDLSFCIEQLISNRLLSRTVFMLIPSTTVPFAIIADNNGSFIKAFGR